MEIRGSKNTQRGAVLVLFTIGMLTILGIAGLALDGSHQMLNKARLQSAVDAAALASAKSLDETATMSEARDAAEAMFDTNAGNLGNHEMAAADITVTTTFSANSNPFVAGSYVPGDKGYVRVVATGFSMQMWLIQLLGATGKTVTASAVAGPSPSINYSCNLVPLIVCGDPDDVPTEGGPTFWGYVNGDVQVLKSGSDQDCDTFAGCGNFQLARLDGAGGADVRDALAGGYAGCTFVEDSVPTEPGNTVGPVTQGLNTRLNKYSGPVSPEDYPPDVVTTQQNSQLQSDGTDITLDNGATIVNDASDLDYNLSDYQADVAAANYDVSPAAGGQFDRRNMPVIIADCDTAGNGQTTVDVLGFGCFFLLQEAIQKGQENEIFGEFGTECSIPGFSGPDPTVIPGPYVIQLYNDTLSRDS
jgi:Flp pilus assembly protein TadG